MTSNVMNFPDENTAVTTNWVAEAGTMTGGEPVFGTKVLTAKKLAGRAVFSLELLDDGNVALMPFLQSCFAEKFGGELDFQAAQGPGTTFTGIRDAVSVGTTSATNGTNGTNITYAGTASTQSSLVKVFCGANEGMARNDGIFLCGPGVYAKIMGLVDLNGQPIVRLGTVEGQPNNTLFGRPIVVSARLTNYTVGAGTVSVGMLAYGSPSGLLFGVRQGMRWDVTDQVHWGTYQADARLVGRFAFVVGVPTAWVRQYDVIV
jgi:HK97 family phage major capsid protein